MMTQRKHYHKPSVILAALIIPLSFFDAYVTNSGVQRGIYREVNPIMAYYLDINPQLFFLVKMIMTCFACIGLASSSNLLFSRYAIGFLFTGYLIITTAHAWSLLNIF